MGRVASLVRNFVELLGHRTTRAYVQSPAFLLATLIVVHLFDAEHGPKIVWWHLPIFASYTFFVLLYTTARLESGAWSFHKWADRITLLSAPGAMYYGYIAYLIPPYFIVPALGILAFGLPLLGVGKQRLWTVWTVSFLGTYFIACFTFPQSTGTARELFETQPMVFGFQVLAWLVMLIWLTTAAYHVHRLVHRSGKNLYHARRSRRRLDRVNRELREKRSRMQAELRIARKIQEGILPDVSRFASHPRLHVAARYVALDSIGGDYYDFVEPAPNQFGFFVADVSGHGVPAALVTTMSKVAFTNHSRHSIETPEKVLSAVNADLYEFVRDLDHYLTASYLTLDLTNNIARYTSGGHTPALHYRPATDTLEEWTTPDSFFLGVEPDVQYYSIERKIQAGDRILLYTDGLTDMRNTAGDFYGELRLEPFLREHAAADGETFLSALLEDLNQFSKGAERHDDMAALCLDIK